MKLAALDATLEGNKELATAAGVRGYPTIKMYRGGEASAATEYGGPREAPGIVDYLSKQAGPAAVAVATAEEAAKLAEKEEVVIVRLFCACLPSLHARR